MTKVIRGLLFVIVICCSFVAHAQIYKDDSRWTFEAKKMEGSHYQLIVHCILSSQWHLYAFKPGGDGSLISPEIKFAPNKSVKLKGPVRESGKLITETIEGVGVVHMFKNKVDYIQDAEISNNTVITGTYFYQICNDVTCLSPTTKDIKLEVTDAGGGMDSAVTDTTPNVTAAAEGKDPASKQENASDTASSKTATSDTKAPTPVEEQSLIMLFLTCLAGGIASVLTPCIYSMIPITVSFFTKRSKTRAQGIRNAIYYSMSIIIIFTLLGILISLIFGPAAIDTLSTNWIANLLFFTLFVVFGISFLGAFEITLPSSWTNFTDSKAGVNNFSGIFFMALTLAIVSFSCTGPIVGSLLVAASKGGLLGPAIGMFGFSLGLSLPFAVFAIFPGWMNKLAASGGWLNQVKVVLGFVELMMALKFLSNADLAQGWRLLDREIFIAAWIVLSILTGIYLLGKIKLSHDDEPAKNVYGQEYISIFKLFLSIFFFVFAVYLLPGMWGAPLNGVSAFVPPMGTFDRFAIGGSSSTAPVANSGESEIHPVKYVSEFKIHEPPVVFDYGLEIYYDYEEGIAAGRKLKKPIMLDFTGINCANCRKMESQVWSSPEVAKRMKNDFVVISLYCDMTRILLPVDKQYFSKNLNKKVVDLGSLYEDMEIEKYASNARPIYFFVDENGTRLVSEGYSVNLDPNQFVQHLEKVKANYKKLHP